jgi:hypothetical protein
VQGQFLNKMKLTKAQECAWILACLWICFHQFTQWVLVQRNHCGKNPLRVCDEDDPECYTTPSRERSCSGNVEILNKLKPKSDHNNFAELLGPAAMFGGFDAVDCVLEVGADPNARQMRLTMD